MRILLLAGAALLAAGCVDQPTRFTPQPYAVPVKEFVRCDASVPAEPAWAAAAIAPEADIGVQSRAMRAELAQREGYETILKGVIDGCSTPPPPPPPTPPPGAPPPVPPTLPQTKGNP